MTRTHSLTLFSLALAIISASAQIRLEPAAFQQATQLNPAFIEFSRPTTQSGPVIGKPMSGKEVRRHVQTLADGTQVENSETTLFYRDAMRRMRDERENEALLRSGGGLRISSLEADQDRDERGRTGRNTDPDRDGRKWQRG